MDRTPILNVAFYHFTPLADPAGLKVLLQKEMSGLPVKGTLILAPEGLNGFWAGPEDDVRRSLSFLQKAISLPDLRWKESFSDSIPFVRLEFKLKPEIVTFRVPAVSPPPANAGRISPAELANWYREKKDFVVLDTRNEYEVRLGRFAGAESLGVDHFVDFAEAARQAPDEWKKKPVVTYCTGGIRCEKAAPYLAQLGFEEVYQLDGGILGYFESQGGKNWEGECFVFDQRIALQPDLQASGARLCHNCQGPIPATQETCIHCGTK